LLLTDDISHSVANYVPGEHLMDDITLVNVATIIGLIQAKFPANKLEHESFDALEKLGLLNGTELENMDNFMHYCNETLGTHVFLETLTTLITNGILKFDNVKFDYHIEVTGEGVVH
jgi:hypothetical protein